MNNQWSFCRVKLLVFRRYPNCVGVDYIVITSAYSEKVPGPTSACKCEYLILDGIEEACVVEPRKLIVRMPGSMIVMCGSSHLN